jgi:phage protein D
MPPNTTTNGTGVKAAQPTIVLAGHEDASLTNGLLELRIEERVDGLYACEAIFGNWGPSGAGTGFLYFDRKTLDFGKDLAVRLGQDSLFQGRITGLRARFSEGSPPTLTVLAEDRFQDLRMVRRTRTFADITDTALFEQIASDHSLTPDVNANGPTHKVLAQLGQSDLAFARERARAIDAELWVSDKTLSVRTRPNRGSQAVRLAYGHELREVELSADLAGQRTGIDVSGWDVAAKNALSEHADAGSLGAELGQGDSGGSILQSAFGERKETVAHAVPLTSDEARARVQAIFKRQARRFVSGRGIAETDARLRVGAKVTLDGLGPLFAGDYYVTEAVHRFDRSRGLRTELAVERPGLGRPL